MQKEINTSLTFFFYLRFTNTRLMKCRSRTKPVSSSRPTLSQDESSICRNRHTQEHRSSITRGGSRVIASRDNHRSLLTVREFCDKRATNHRHYRRCEAVESVRARCASSSSRRPVSFRAYVSSTEEKNAGAENVGRGCPK